ncbi:hypothetical protein DL96DRAFT_1631178 [Flagelloscypha sp. PMI_526]|nr:hypothetical protein DL96DRAFT_1631178 [Flagelloscypha sp. PMI_526]
MKRAIKAGLFLQIVLSSRFCGEEPYIQDFLPVGKTLLAYPLTYSTHPNIKPWLMDAYSQAMTECNFLPWPTVKAAFMKICISAVQIHLREKINDVFAQQTVRCGNDNCEFPDPLLRSCSRCFTVQYCSRLCQKEDWKVHKYFCREYVPNTATKIPSRTLILEDRLNQC